WVEGEGAAQLAGRRPDRERCGERAGAAVPGGVGGGGTASVVEPPPGEQAVVEIDARHFGNLGIIERAAVEPDVVEPAVEMIAIDRSGRFRAEIDRVCRGGDGRGGTEAACEDAIDVEPHAVAVIGSRDVEPLSSGREGDL